MPDLNIKISSSSIETFDKNNISLILANLISQFGRVRRPVGITIKSDFIKPVCYTNSAWNEMIEKAGGEPFGQTVVDKE